MSTREYKTGRMRERKLAAIAYKGGECMDCGFDDLTRPEVFDFDHLPQFEKTFELGKFFLLKWDKIATELDKCELVCSNCHRTRTKGRA